MANYVDKYGRDYDTILATQTAQLQALRAVVTPAAYDELAFYCDTINQPAPPPENSRERHSAKLHTCPYGYELTQRLLAMGQRQQLL